LQKAFIHHKIVGKKKQNISTTSATTHTVLNEYTLLGICFCPIGGFQGQ